MPDKWEARSKAAWKAIRKEVTTELVLGSMIYGFGRTSCPGTFTIEANLWTMAYPLAAVWYQFVDGRTIQVMNSFVTAGVRRCGLRTFLHEKMIDAYPTVNRIISDSGTREGAAWMKAVGYQRTKDGYWFFVPDRKKRRQWLAVAKIGS